MSQPLAPGERCVWLQQISARQAIPVSAVVHSVTGARAVVVTDDGIAHRVTLKRLRPESQRGALLARLLPSRARVLDPRKGRG